MWMRVKASLLTVSASRSLPRRFRITPTVRRAVPALDFYFRAGNLKLLITDVPTISDECRDEVFAFKVQRNSNINANVPLGKLPRRVSCC